MADKAKIAELDKAIKGKRAELEQPLQRYRDEKAAKVQKVAQSIQSAEREQAAEECDTEKTVELSEKRAEVESRLKHLREMQERVNSLPVFPDGAITQEWATLCEKIMPDWRAAVLQVETLAAGYKAACAALLQMHDTLLAVRADLEEMAAQDGHAVALPTRVFTAGIDGDKLSVERGDYARLKGLPTPITGRAL